MKIKISTIGWALLLIMGTALQAQETKKPVKNTKTAKKASKSAQNQKTAKNITEETYTNDTAFALVGYLAQQERLKNFYNFEIKTVTPQKLTSDASISNMPLIAYSAKTGKFEPQQPILPLQLVPKTFTVPQTSTVKS